MPAIYTYTIEYLNDNGTIGAIMGSANTLPEMAVNMARDRNFYTALGYPLVGQEATEVCLSCKGAGRMHGKLHNNPRRTTPCPAKNE